MHTGNIYILWPHLLTLMRGLSLAAAISAPAAPPEVRSVIETALQLLPEDKQLAALRPRIDHAPAAAAAAAAAANANRSMQQQQQQQGQQQPRLKSSGSLPHYRQQQNGGLVNGAEPLSRCAGLFARCVCRHTSGLLL
jgi:hypothetical protein